MKLPPTSLRPACSLRWKKCFRPYATRRIHLETCCWQSVVCFAASSRRYRSPLRKLNRYSKCWFEGKVMTNPTMNLLLFAMLPYVALFVFFLGTIMRYRKAPFTYSSLSSQFLENNQHFWGLTALHYGIFAILMGHLMGLLIPRQVLLWNSRPLRLYVLEIFSLAFALMALVGFVGVIERRIRYPKARTVTTPADWIVESMLILQAAVGIYVAIFYPWGTSWYSTSAAPYLHSIFLFRPDISYLVT